MGFSKNQLLVPYNPKRRRSAMLDLAKMQKRDFLKKYAIYNHGVYWRPIGSHMWAFQRTHYWTPKIQNGGDPPCWILMPKCKTRFSQTISNFQPWCLLMTFRKSYVGLFKKLIIWALKSKMAENRHDVIFFCRGLSDFDKISETGAEWHVYCDDMGEIKTRSRIPIRRTFGRIKWHVIS